LPPVGGHSPVLFEPSSQLPLSAVASGVANKTPTIAAPNNNRILICFIMYSLSQWSQWVLLAFRQAGTLTDRPRAVNQFEALVGHQSCCRRPVSGLRIRAGSGENHSSLARPRRRRRRTMGWSLQPTFCIVLAAAFRRYTHDQALLSLCVPAEL